MGNTVFSAVFFSSTSFCAVIMLSLTPNFFFLFLCAVASMDGADLCFEIVKRADAGFVYSEAVARWGTVSGWKL